MVGLYICTLYQINSLYEKEAGRGIAKNRAHLKLEF